MRGTKRHNKKAATLILAAFLLILTVPEQKTAATNYDGPYSSYLYDEWDASVSAPQVYLAEYTLTGTEIGCGPLSLPQDLFIYKEREIFIADTNNQRIVILDSSFQVVSIIESLNNGNEEVTLNEPIGIYANEDYLYIADKSGVVWVVTRDGTVVLEISALSHPLISDSFIFTPTKVLADRAGRIYVLSYGCFYGLLQFSPQGDFLGYYGANPVVITPSVYLDYIWKQILSEEQREAMVRLLPVEFSGIDYGPDEFVYTTTVSGDTQSGQIKKLNPIGVNVLKGREGAEIQFGDYEYDTNLYMQVRSNFIDIHVDNNLFIYGLDITRRRVFVYDSEGQLVGVFGGKGYQKGTFQQPVAIDSIDDTVLVLDATKNNITVFRPTEYCQLIRSANEQYMHGNYEASYEPWLEVTSRSIGSQIAFTGIGKALSHIGDYRGAMDAFESGSSRYDYSKAFQEYRLAVIREAIPWAVTIVLIAVAAGYALFYIRRRLRSKHPVDTVRK